MYNQSMPPTQTKNKFPKIFFLSLVFSAFLSPQLCQPARAQSALGISAIPPRLYIPDLNPGDVVTKVIKVRNESSQTQFLTTSIVDFIVNNDEGTPIFLKDGIGPDQNRWAASHWLQVSPTQIQIKPGETKSLTLTAIVPQDAAPGGHYAAVFHAADVNATINGTGSAVRPEVGTLVYLTVAGPITENAAVTSFTAPKFSEFGPISFTTIINNLSDVHISPIGSITVKNWFGLKTDNLPLEKLNIFPYTSRQFDNSLARKWLFGRYQAKLNAAYGSQGQLLTATLYFWVIPWRLILLALLAIAIIIILIKLIKLKNEKHQQT